MPGGEIETRVLRISHPAHSPEVIAAMFRRAEPAIIGRISEGAFQLDMRTIEDPGSAGRYVPAALVKASRGSLRGNPGAGGELLAASFHRGVVGKGRGKPSSKESPNAGENIQDH